MDTVEQVYRFYESYRGEKQVIGRSVCGNPIVALFVGRGGPRILVQCAIHAREWVTALLALELIAQGMPFGRAAFVPLSNPDGAMLALRGGGFLRLLPACRAEFLRKVNGSADFSQWKADANAVDCNVNFDAEWGTGAQNVRIPSPANYIGPYPFSEPETRALRNFTLAFRPDATVSFHTKGQEIYWEFGQTGAAFARDKKIAESLAAETGYAAKLVRGSAGGYKDWCIRALGIPSFTVEAGSDSLPHPLAEPQLPQLVRENARIPALLAELVWKIKTDS
mgnify:CR=1 FL=1